MTWRVSDGLWKLVGFVSMLGLFWGMFLMWLEGDTTRGAIVLSGGLALLLVWLRMRVRLPRVELVSHPGPLRRAAEKRKQDPPTDDPARKRKQERKRHEKPARWAWIRHLPRRGRITDGTR